MRLNRAVCALAGVISIGSLRPAHAQQASGFGLNTFEPSERGSEWFALESLDLRGKLRPAVGLVAEYQDRPLAVYNVDGSFRSALVSTLFVLHPGASLVLWDRLRVGLNVPLQIYANGDGATIGGVTYSPPTHAQAIGDIRLGADVRLFGEYGDVVTGAVGAQVGLPTGDPNSYSGDGDARLAPRALVAGDIGRFAYAARAGFEYRTHSESFASASVGSRLFFGVSAGIRAANGKLLIGPELFGSTVTNGSDVFKRKTTPVEGLLGSHYTAGEVRVGAAIGVGLTGGYGAPIVHVIASLEWAPGIETDLDHDSVLDNDDACPDVPGVRSDDPKTNGCPPSPPDRDHDGIVDDNDACPDVAGKHTEDPTTDGCPDKDGDGVIDKLDACVDEPGVATKDPKTNGCPSDRDKDDIADDDDACPDVAGIETDDPKTNGCPNPDRDKDGILNDADACPDEPGPASPDPKRNGCPKAFIQAGQIRILDQVKFKTASAEILPGKDSADVLEAVLKVLNTHPEVKNIEVEGHTDNRGNAAYNRGLSARRADTVMTWLVAHGIDLDRLSVRGFGPDKPIATNDTEAGRQENRRVEFHILGGETK